MNTNQTLATIRFWHLGCELWSDTRGGANFASYLLLVTIIVIGSVVGLASLRDQITQELGDVGTGINSLNQSFTLQIDLNGDADFIDPGEINVTHVDTEPDVAGENTDTAGAPPGCMAMTTP